MLIYQKAPRECQQPVWRAIPRENLVENNGTEGCLPGMIFFGPKGSFLDWAENQIPEIPFCTPTWVRFVHKVVARPTR